MTDCAYCGCDVEAHDPVYVREGDGDSDDDEETAFCNYGCLGAHIDAAGLADGTTCRVDV